VARPRYPKHEGPLPPPLPPETRTVGQLVAETVRLYGRRPIHGLAIGLGPAALAVALAETNGVARTLVALVAGPVLLSGCLAAATLVAHAGDARRLPVAVVAGIPAFLPLAASRLYVFAGIYLVVLAWLALVGLAVPVALVEGRGLLGALVRGVRLARADYVHAVGSLATLAIVIFLTGLVLFLLLAGVGEEALPVAAFLTLVVLSPLFFLGTAMLYLDQAARVRH
jgi:hypothetical protein